MRRPYKVRNIRSGRVRSYATGEAGLNHIALFMDGPLAQFAEDFEWIDADGKAYPLPPMLETMRKIRRIYDISKPYLTLR